MTTKTTTKSETKPTLKTAVKAVAPKETGKKDIQKLQRAIVDGLEDVKGQEIVVFDTEHLSSLFERVIIASGTSNRQTKGLASSVLDAVRKAGFEKPRVEGEANGEWIIVDCGQAVVHVMQPNFRTYYNLEELWGDKPVRLKLGSAKPAMSSEAKVVKVVVAEPSGKPAVSLRRSSAAKKGVEEAFPSKAQLKKTQDAKAAAAKKAATKPVSKKTASSTNAKDAVKPKVKTLIVNAPAKPVAKKTAAKSNPAARVPAKKAATRKA